MGSTATEFPIGARVRGDAVTFRIWAPSAPDLTLQIEGRPPVPLAAQPDGYYEAIVDGIAPGARYRYVVQGRGYPDPASCSQPEGVHGPSEVVGADFSWTDGHWRGVALRDLILYELHVGTFTRDGTFDAVIPYLSYLRALGITAIELMPVAQFPGRRNWGYDGVGLFAPQSTYGGPAGLKRLIDACHAAGLGVILDVVYNHLGPEGNYLDVFGPYFTDRYRTPWGRAINYDGPDSDPVRAFVTDNARHWITDYHVDGLRLDAIHGIFDFSARHILQDIADAAHAEATRLGRTALVIAESDLNDPRIIRPPEAGGYGLDAQWSDDFHHALHTTLTRERSGYYEDFARFTDLAAAMQDGFVYHGQHSPHRKRRHGAALTGCPPAQLVVCAQNHDQVGNRAQGDRLSTLAPPAALHAAAAAVLLAANTPLLFMGEEYGESAPFQYFIDHEDRDLVEAVRQGRRREFVAFGWDEVPDPADPATFERSRLSLGDASAPLAARTPAQRALFEWYAALIELRKRVPAFGAAVTSSARLRVHTFEPAGVLAIHRWAGDGSAGLLLLGLAATPQQIALHDPGGRWRRELSSGEPPYGDGASIAPQELMLDGTERLVQLGAYEAVIYLPVG